MKPLRHNSLPSLKTNQKLRASWEVDPSPRFHQGHRGSLYPWYLEQRGDEECCVSDQSLFCRVVCYNINDMFFPSSIIAVVSINNFHCVCASCGFKQTHSPTQLLWNCFYRCVYLLSVKLTARTYSIYSCWSTHTYDLKWLQKFITHCPAEYIVIVTPGVFSSAAALYHFQQFSSHFHPLFLHLCLSGSCPHFFSFPFSVCHSSSLPSFIHATPFHHHLTNHLQWKGYFTPVCQN